MDLFVVIAVVVLFIHSFFNEMEKASNLFQLFFFLNKLKYFVVYDCKTKSIGGKH